MSDEGVTLINVFTVPAGEEHRFVERWKANAAVMREAPGLIDYALHRSLDTSTTFRFVNVAHWRSRKELEEAQGGPRFRQAVADLMNDPALHVSAHPATYGVVDRFQAT